SASYSLLRKEASPWLLRNVFARRVRTRGLQILHNVRLDCRPGDLTGRAMTSPKRLLRQPSASYSLLPKEASPWLLRNVFARRVRTRGLQILHNVRLDCRPGDP